MRSNKVIHAFCQLAGPLTDEDGVLRVQCGRNRPGKVDRSPTGTGCSARWRCCMQRGVCGRRPVHGALDHWLNLSLHIEAERVEELQPWFQ